VGNVGSLGFSFAIYKFAWINLFEKKKIRGLISSGLAILDQLSYLYSSDLAKKFLTLSCLFSSDVILEILSTSLVILLCDIYYLRISIHPILAISIFYRRLSFHLILVY